MTKRWMPLLGWGAGLLIAFLGIEQAAKAGVEPLWIGMGVILLFYVLIALAKFPAAFMAPLLFISRGMKIPAGPFDRIVHLEALPVGGILLLVAICVRLAKISAEHELGSLRESFAVQRRGILAFVAFAAIVTLSYSYTQSPLYGSAKLSSFLLFGGLMFVAPFILLREEGDFRHFAYATVALALAVSLQRARADSQGVFWKHEVVTHIGNGQLIGMAIILLLNFKFVRHRLARLLIIPCLLCLAVGLIASEVRGAMLALFIVLIASLFAPRRKMSLISPKAAFLSLVVIVGALFLVPGHWFQGGAATMFRAKTQEITQFVDQGAYSWKGSGGQRLIFFGAAADAMAQKPILGWGIGGWSHYFWHSDIWEYPHNVFLEVGVEQGLVGLAAYLVFLAFAFKAAKECFDDPQGHFAFVLPLLAYIILLTCSTGDIDDCRFIWFTCGLAFVASRMIERQTEPAAALEPAVAEY